MRSPESEHHLLGQHLAGDAVEQPAGADGRRSRSRRALQDAALGPDAGSRARESPRLRGRLASRRRGRLRVQKRRQRHRADAHTEYRLSRRIIGHLSCRDPCDDMPRPPTFSLARPSARRLRRSSRISASGSGSRTTQIGPIERSAPRVPRGARRDATRSVNSTRTQTGSSSFRACRTSPDADGGRWSARRDTASVRSRRSPARP